MNEYLRSLELCKDEVIHENFKKTCLPLCACDIYLTIFMETRLNPMTTIKIQK